MMAFVLLVDRERKWGPLKGADQIESSGGARDLVS